MGQWSFLRGISKEHPNHGAHVVLDLNDEHFVVVADKNRATAVRRQNSANGNRHNISVHTDSVGAEAEKTSPAGFVLTEGRAGSEPERGWHAVASWVAPSLRFVQSA